MSIKFFLKSISYKKIIVFVGLVALIPTLSACGFQWQQKNAIPSQLQHIYLQSATNYDQFTASLKHSLTTDGVDVFNNPKKGNSILEIISTDFSHSGINAYSSAQASVYTFTFTAILSLHTPDGKAIFDRENFSVSRNITLNPNELLVASNQVTTAEAEMQQEVVRKVLNRLCSKEIKIKLHINN